MAIKSLQHSSITDNIFYRSMLAGNTAFDPGDEFLLEEQVLSSSAASVTFSGLDAYAGVYQHLQIVGAARIDRNTPYGSVSITLNGNTSSIYSKHQLSGNGSSVASSASINIPRTYDIIQCTGAQNEANNYGGFAFDLLDPFSSSKNKTMRVLSGHASGSNPTIALQSGLYPLTTAVSSIELVGEVGNIVAGSRFSLYGVK